jgi:hypothetical protein
MAKQTQDETKPPARTTTAREDYIDCINELENVVADKVNPAFKSRYASLSEILSSVKPVWKKYDLTLKQKAVTSEGYVYVVSEWFHKRGELNDVSSLGWPMAEIKTVQQMGSVITYLKRYALSTLCSISVDLDDDGNAASLPGNGQIRSMDGVPPDAKPVRFIPRPPNA